MALAGAAALVLIGGRAAFDRTASANAANASAPPATAVSVRTVDPEMVHVWSDFSGRMAAVDYAEVRPEVSGRIVDIRFKDGQVVHQGDILFVIDPRPYQAAVAKATADLASARSNAALAETLYERDANLVKQQALAANTYEQQKSARDVAVANVSAAEATLAQAQLDVDHAYVKAPISGRVSRPEITLGNLVEAAAAPQAPLLTSIVSNDGIYADFDVDEQTYLKSIRADARSNAQEQKIPVELTLPGDARVYKGTIYSFDNRIDTGSGTIRARARFDNTDGGLVPGMFVSVKMEGDTVKNALLVPERAIANDQSKTFLYVVGRDNKAAERDVTLGDTVNGERIVTAGLNPGERVIVDGMQRVTPGSTVSVQEASADAGKGDAD